MFNVRSLVAGAFAAGLVCMIGLSASAFNKEAKYTIKEVMKAVQKDGLCKAACGEKGTTEEKDKLVEYATALAENDCPKGDAEDWKKKTGALLKATKALQAGKKGAADQVKKANNCKACHDLHK